MSSPDLARLAAEAYVYGYPLVYNVSEMQRISRDGLGSMPPAPLNSFGHAPTLAGPADDFVTINNDTLYAMAPLDLSGGPLLLHVPDTGDRYYVLQFVDAWTNNFAYVGKRATGTAEGTFLIAPPGWSGEVPAGTTRIDAPTHVVAIVGRIACDGVDDLPAVRLLQPQFTLTPVERTGVDGLPEPADGVADELLFWERLRRWMAAYPPAASDLEYQARFAPLGLFDDDSPYVVPEPALRDALLAGASAGAATIEEATRKGTAPPVNGWILSPHFFDYNLDHFSVGTLDDPAWKIADRTQARLIRAFAARAGLWGNHGYEATYGQVWMDGDGVQLDGTHTYTWTLDQEVPVGAFWSLTMYNVPNFYLEANPIDRYSIGDRTPGLVHDAAGSLTITISHAEPTDPSARANWLPAPAGPFRPVVRYYQPGEAILDGSYVPPPVVRSA